MRNNKPRSETTATRVRLDLIARIDELESRLRDVNAETKAIDRDMAAQDRIADALGDESRAGDSPPQLTTEREPR